MEGITKERVFKVLDKVNPHNRYWCKADLCACLGCVNRSGLYMNEIVEQLGRRVTEEEFEEWVLSKD